MCKKPWPVKYLTQLINSNLTHFSIVSLLASSSFSCGLCPFFLRNFEIIMTLSLVVLSIVDGPPNEENEFI